MKAAVIVVQQVVQKKGAEVRRAYKDIGSPGRTHLGYLLVAYQYILMLKIQSREHDADVHHSAGHWTLESVGDRALTLRATLKRVDAGHFCNLGQP